jgi:hypothetical protein
VTVETQLLALIILIEWVLLVTVAAPISLVGRFDKAPNLGIAIWFFLFGSVLLATAIALGIAVGSIFQTFFGLQSGQPVWVTFFASLAPWLLLALAGILVALANLRFAPLYMRGQKAEYLSLITPREVFRYRRARVHELDLPGYYAFSNGHNIYLTTAAFELPARQLDAILRHEYGHIRLSHEALKRISALAVRLTPWLAVSRAFDHELERLCEVAADHYALRRVYSKDLFEARAKFL